MEGFWEENDSNWGWRHYMPLSNAPTWPLCDGIITGNESDNRKLGLFQMVRDKVTEVSLCVFQMDTPTVQAEREISPYFRNSCWNQGLKWLLLSQISLWENWHKNHEELTDPAKSVPCFTFFMLWCNNSSMVYAQLWYMLIECKFECHFISIPDRVSMQQMIWSEGYIIYSVGILLILMELWILVAILHYFCLPFVQYINSLSLDCVKQGRTK